MKDKEYTVSFGSISVTFYPLLVQHIRTMPEEMKALVGVKRGDDPFEPDRFAKLLKLWVVSARRGNPSVTEEQVEAVVDIRNLLFVNRAMLGQDPEEPLPKTVNGSGAEVADSTPTSPQIGGDSTHA
jgi:hypothetical protein